MKENGNGTFHGVEYEKLDLVRTSTHINRWESDGKGSLIINAREDSGSYSRSTTHFTLNTVVQDHGSNKFSEGKFAVIGNLGEAAKENIVSGVSSVDTWLLPTNGKMKIPGATLVAPDNVEIPERFNGLNLVRYSAHEDVATNYKNLSTAIEGELIKRGSPVFEADLYGWKGKSIVSEKDQLGISNWIGSDTKLPGVHSGSIDATMESIISDVLKLKKYTQEDNFHVNDIKPTQQLGESEYLFKKFLPEAHPKAQAMYKEKFNKAFEGTKIEVEKWRDKHYPPEPVSKIPEGLPLPNGSSTAIPPPIPHLPGTSIPPPVPTNMPIDTPLDMVGKSSEWTPSKTKLPYEQQLLRNIADLQKEVQPDHHSVDGILKEGLFGGTNNKLNVDSNGNVVLTRFASDEQHLTKNWVNVGQKELLETSLFHGGGRGLPTSGFANWSFGLSHSNKTVGNFVIPPKDFLQGIKDKNIYLGNLGEGEFVLNPNWAKDYLSSINDKKVTVDKSGSVRYEGSSSISDTPPEFHGKSSEFLPNELKSKLKALEPNLLDGYVLDAYRKGAPYNKVIRMAEEYQHMVTDINKSINSILDVPITKSGVNTRAPTNNHKKVEENSVKNFFNDKINIKSFDTETTGLDTDSVNFNKRAKIYELGLANNGIDGVEEHVNPFFIFGKDKKPTQEVLSKQSAETRLKLMNGGFSLKAHEKGNFKELLNKFPLQLKSLDETLSSMFENVKSKDVIVLQNMNFENKILKSSYDQGLISKETYEGIANRMNTVSLDKKGDLLHLFERPASVQEKMREADMIFNTEYLFNRSEESFQKYRTLLNESMEIYKSVINDPNRSGAVAVELMDVTKTFMANAADKGFLSKEASTLGLNMDFLMQAMSLGEESHTALQDAKDTITVYNKLLTANQELLDNNISDETKTLLTRITESQPKEVNRKFISTVRSILSDFNIKGNTKLTDRYSWYSPEVNLREGSDYNIKLDQVITKRKQTTTNLNDALLNALERYSVYNDNLDGFNRKEYVDNLLKNNTSTTSMYSQVDSDYFKGVGSLSNNNGMTPTDVPLINNNQSPTISEDIKSKLSKKQLGLGILGAGLAYMAFQSRPEPIEKNYDNVSQQFYDDQYLGTAFVDFRERNKHYMM